MVYGMMVFLVVLVLEAALAACRVITKSLQRGTTAVLRGISLLAAAVFFALSGAEWRFRYYALIAVLAVLAAVSVVQWLRKKAAEEGRGRARLLWRAGAMAALLLIVSLPALVFPEYEPLPTTGKYPVKTSVNYFTDESRAETFDPRGGARALSVEFWYPGQDGPFPLILFSHGAFGTRQSNESLFIELAGHGYVVCSIDHAYHCLYTTRENGESVLIDGGYMNELRGENAKQDKRGSLKLYRKWMGTRVADIEFVIDVIVSKAKENPNSGPFGLIDVQKIGMIGHSLGGSAALGIGRSRSDIGAVVALEAPFLCDILDVRNDSFVFENAEYPVPVLNVYSDSSWAHLAQWPQYAQNAKLLSGAQKHAYSLHLAGAGHLSLTDLSLASPILTRVLDGRLPDVGTEEYLARLNETCLAFFDRFLKDMIQ